MRDADRDAQRGVHFGAWMAGMLGALVGVLVGLAVAPRSSPREAAAVEPTGASSADVVAELRTIRTLLEERDGDSLAAPVELPAADGVPGEPAAAPFDPSELVAALRSLERAVRTADGAGTAGTTGATPAPAAGLRPSEEDLATPREVDLGALRDTRAAMKGEGLQVLPDLFGLSPAQVYRRFGTPAVVGNSPGRVRWMYRDPDYPGYLVVTFFDGYVGWIHVAEE